MVIQASLVASGFPPGHLSTPYWQRRFIWEESCTAAAGPYALKLVMPLFDSRLGRTCCRDSAIRWSYRCLRLTRVTGRLTSNKNITVGTNRRRTSIYALARPINTTPDLRRIPAVQLKLKTDARGSQAGSAGCLLLPPPRATTSLGLLFPAAGKSGCATELR